MSTSQCTSSDEIDRPLVAGDSQIAVTHSRMHECLRNGQSAWMPWKAGDYSQLDQSRKASEEGALALDIDGLWAQKGQL